MANSRIKNTTRSIFWGIVNKIVTIIVPFITRTVLIYRMGIDYAGLNTLFSSLLSVLSLAELGIGTAMVFSLYKPVAENDKATICAYLNLYKKAYRVIGVLIFGVGVLILPFINHFVSGAYPDNINLYVLYIIYLLNTVISYLTFAYRQSLFTANQRNDVINNIATCTNLVSNALQILALVFFRSYYLSVLALLVATVFNNFLILISSKKMYPDIEPSGKIGKEELEGVKKNIGGLFLQKVGGVVLYSVDSIVISSFLGLNTLGIYNNYYYIINAIFAILGIIQASLIPSVGNSIVNQTVEQNYKNFWVFNYLYSWLSVWFAICYLCLVQPFITLWIGSENLLPMGMCVSLTLYLFLNEAGNAVYTYKEAAGIWWQGKWVPIIAAAVNLILNISLVNFIGLYGIVLSTVVAIVCIYIPINSWLVFHYYFKKDDKLEKYLLSLIGYLFIGIIGCTITYMICTKISAATIGGFAVQTLLCIVVPNIVWWAITWKSATRKNATVFIRKIITRK